MQEASERLHKFISELENRISAVTRPEGPNTVASDKQSIAPVALAGGLSETAASNQRASGCTRCSNGSSCKQNGPTLGGTSAHNSNRARIQERDYQWTA